VRRSLSPHEARVAGRDYLISDLMLSDGSCVTVGQDITAMRAEQRATLDAVRRLELALSVAGLSICEADPDADTIRVVAGETPDDGGAPIPASLRSALSSIVPEDRERFESGLRDVWEGRRNACRDEVTVERGGAPRRVRFDVALARDPHGPGRRLVAARADVTALRQAEAAARQKTAADLANRAKSDFLSRVGHELRTPLNAIRGLAQVLQRETADDGASRHALVSHIVGASEHLAALLDDLLDTSQVEAGRVAIRAEPTPLAPLVRECLRMMAPQAAGHGIALESARVPDGLRVMADATRLRQILLNLLSNAVKYNRPQGRVRLEASADPGDGFARIAVSDTGPGLSRDEAARVFRPFERLAREGTPRDGLGLGLSIAQGLAQAMGGAIEVASEPGHGATFTVRLPALPDAAAGDGEARPGGDDARADGPAAEEAVAEGRSLGDGAIGVEAFVDGTFVDATLGGGSRRVTADAAADPPTYRPPGGTPPRRVLYVEDNRLNGVLMKQIARQVPGLVMQVVETGEEALAMMASFSPDLLLLDNDLPGMSGLETHRMLKADPRWAQLPAVLVSADATADAIARARALGFDDYWVKPLDVPRVIEALGGAPGRTPTGAPTGA
jgi:signal transduction histidine kinase/CheY-like chemotaxis protein